MGPLVYEGNVKASWVPAIADPTSPAADEIAAGEELSSYIPKDGVEFPSDRPMADTGALDTTFASTYPVGRGGALVVTLKRRNRRGESAAWEIFKAGIQEGFWVFGFEGSNTQADDEVDVYQVATAEVVRGNPEATAEQRFVINCGVQAEHRAVAVVAGV